LIRFSDGVSGAEISPVLQQQVLRLTVALRPAAGVVNVHPAYASVLVDFDPLATSHDEMKRMVNELYVSAATAPLPEPRTLEIPVAYGGVYGPDLEGVAALTGHTPQEVIEIHAGAEYLVYFLGFSPGFPYLGGMPESIAVPRRETPLGRVPAGSVAIGGRQTGIYPTASPGGWRIIGRTPLRLFQPEAERPVLLEMGDRVRFVPMSQAGF
jgi:inhibitor of KinA